VKCIVFDIESSALEAVGSGFVLCTVLKPLGEKAITLRYDKMSCKPGQEKPLIRKTFDILSEYDLWIGHNIQTFDVAYLRSRAIQLDIPLPSKRPFLYDTKLAFKRTGFRTVDNGFGKPSASLAMVADFFNIPQMKTALYPREHWKTVWGEGKERQKAMDALCDHCVRDISMNEKVYWKLLEVDSVWGLRRVS
jgi:DNA polymerase III epsilon subunit-like protein